MQHAGMGYPNGPVDNHWIFSLPSPKLLMLITEARYHHDAAVDHGKEVLVRAIPRIGRRPAELGWAPHRFVTEVLDKLDEIKQPIQEFIPWNELDLQDERGDHQNDWDHLHDRYSTIGMWGLSVLQALQKDNPTVRLHYPAWTPDHYALDHVDLWRVSANLCDVVDFHAYDSLNNIQNAYYDYRIAFPDKPLALTEWHCKGDLEEERRVLEWLAETMVADPLFEAAYFFIWRWHDPHPDWWQDSWDVEHRPSRYDLFMDPPPLNVTPVTPPVPEPTMPDPWQFWTSSEIAAAIKCPQDKIEEHWPRLVEQLGHCGLTDKSTHLAMLATVAIETAHRFEPIHEFRMADGSIPAYWYTYDGGPMYHGRGFIQNTHRYNYETLGPKIASLWGAGPNDFDFVTRPDDLLDPDLSAAAAALYFRDHGRGDGDGIPEAAGRGDWREVRRLVQGGDASLPLLVQYAVALGGATEPVVDDTMVYSINVPDSVILQQNNWSCSVRSTYAALWAMAQVGQGEPVTYGDEGPRDVYEWMVPGVADSSVGLHDGTGAELATLLESKGYTASHLYNCTLEEVRYRAGKYPILIGGGAWNHWAYVRGKTQDGGLILENPSPGHMGIADYLRDSWGKLGPWAMVWIDPTPPAPPTPTPPDYATLTALAYYEDGVVVPALANALANPDDVNLRTQVDSVLRWLRENAPVR